MNMCKKQIACADARAADKAAGIETKKHTQVVQSSISPTTLPQNLFPPITTDPITSPRQLFTPSLSFTSSSALPAFDTFKKATYITYNKDLSEQNENLRKMLHQSDVHVQELKQKLQSLPVMVKQLEIAEKMIVGAAARLDYVLLDYKRSVVFISQTPWYESQMENWQKVMWAEAYNQFAKTVDQFHEHQNASMLSDVHCKQFYVELKQKIVDTFNAAVKPMYDSIGAVYKQKTVTALHKKWIQKKSQESIQKQKQELRFKENRDHIRESLGLSANKKQKTCHY